MARRSNDRLRRGGCQLAGVPLPTLMLELGHESLALTQDYLADVRKPGEAKKAIADADFIPKPKVIKTGTDGFKLPPFKAAIRAMAGALRTR